MDMAKLMAMLSKMDKKDLEKGLAQASEILKNQNSENSNKPEENSDKHYN